jgi:hypothetical protein
MRRVIHRTTSVWKREEGVVILLPTIVVAIFVAPLLRDGFPTLAMATTAFTVLLFVVGTLITVRNIWSGLLAFLLSGSAITLEVMRQIDGADTHAAWRLGAAGLTVLLFTAVMLARVFAPGPVSSYRLAGAVAAYLLVGLTWAYFYSLLETLHTGSFLASGSVTKGASIGAYPAVVYYSFVTLTTVGYGDVLPVSSAARALSNLESLVGVLYPAIFIGRLLSKRDEAPTPGPPDS